MSRIEITDAEIARDLNEAVANAETDDAYTSDELIELTGWGKVKLLGVMKKLLRAGTWERLGVVRTSPLSGVTRRGVNAYRPVASTSD